MFLVALVLFVASIPPYYEQLLTLTEPDIEDPTAVRANLAEAGLSVGFYAAYVTVALEVVPALVWVVVGAAIFWRKSDDWMALLGAYMLVTNGVYGAALEALGTRSGWWLPVTSVGFLGGVSFALFFYLFPDGRFVPRWTRWLALPLVLFFALDNFFPDSPLQPFGNLLFFFFAGTQVLSQIHRYRRVSSPSQRQQTKWVVFGITAPIVALCVLVSLIVVFPALDAEGTLADLIGETVFALSMSLVPISIGVAILRYRLFDIDFVVNRALVYSALTAGVVGIYVLVVGGLGVLLRVEGNVLVSILAAGLVAVLFQPLRYRLQLGVNRLMYGERDDPYAVLSRLGRRLEGTLAPDATLSTIVETVARALKLPYVAIKISQGGELVRAAELGEPMEEPVVLPLIYQHETVGQLVLAPRAPDEEFGPADRRLLEDLVRQAGVAVYAVRLTADLQRSRERLVAAREEERRRLRRDLHDGIGPQLAALTLKLETARNKLAHDPAADALLSDLAQRARSAVGDVRRSVHALRPPALDELGLVPALRETAAQYGQGGLRISVEAPAELPPLPAAVEVAAYHILQEAMTNVVRHARANTCVVSLELHDEAGLLRLDVEDDGLGIGSERGTGVGLSSMRERAEELGGTCEMEPVATAGTRVSVELPCFLGPES